MSDGKWVTIEANTMAGKQVSCIWSKVMSIVDIGVVQRNRIAFAIEMKFFYIFVRAGVLVVHQVHYFRVISQRFASNSSR